MPRTKTKKVELLPNVLKELEELTIRTKTENQPLITSISHSPNGTIVGIDKDGKLWRYNDWLKKWEDRV
jgi:hypothetical protein